MTLNAEKDPILGLSWGNIFFITLVHIMAIVVTPLYFLSHPISWTSGFAIFAVMYVLCGTAITIGYHRYFSHRAFECPRWLVGWLLIWGAASFQNFVLKWLYDHRMHHRYVDTDKDPYNAKRGFWWSHWGWVFHHTPKQDYMNVMVRDWAHDPLILWQKKYYFPIGALVGFGVPLLLGWIAGNALAGFLIGGFVRLAVQYHGTFFVNSLAHYPHIFSSQPYSTKNTSRDSPIVALLTFGEGYHNFHHFSQRDYRNAITWYQFDPGKWIVWSLSKIGVTKNLIRTQESTIDAARSGTH